MVAIHRPGHHHLWQRSGDEYNCHRHPMGASLLVLTASDGAATRSNQVAVTFNLPPVVNAGPARTVNFGATVTLAGTVTDDQLPCNILTNVGRKQAARATPFLPSPV